VDIKGIIIFILVLILGLVLYEAFKIKSLFYQSLKNSRKFKKVNFINPVFWGLGEHLHFRNCEASSLVQGVLTSDTLRLFENCNVANINNRLLDLLKERTCSSFIYFNLNGKEESLGVALNSCKNLISLIFSETPVNNLIPATFETTDDLGKLLALNRLGIKRFNTFNILKANLNLKLFLGYVNNSYSSELEQKWLSEIITELEIALIPTSSKVDNSINYNLPLKTSSYDNSDQLLSYFSHDLRSPLNNIQSVLHLFSKNDLGGDFTELNQIALNNCKRLGELINEVLEFSQLKADKVVSYATVVNLNELLESLLAEWSFAFSSKNLKLNSSVEPNLKVFADERHLLRIFTNLLSNALKYTDCGSVEIKAERIANLSVVEVQIIDTGFGMSSQDQERLYQPFTRFESGKIKEGVGIGLAISKSLAAINKLDLTCQSELGVGTTFFLKIPEQQVNHPVELISQNNIKTVGVKNKNILLIDDDADFCNLLIRFLSPYGFEISSTNSVTSAISILNFSPPDLIISDFEFYDGGIKALKEYILKRKITVPVIGLSGRPINQESFSHTTEFFSRVFQKPISLAELLKCVETL
jgi:signal transduction histidine kinase